MSSKVAGEGTTNVELLYQTYKSLLFSIAYRMLGSVADAENIVQDVYGELNEIELESIGNMKAYLCRMVTNHCLNELNSARRRREIYSGPWLPEPLVIQNNQPAETIERDEQISYAFLVLLEKLAPIERAIFVLREAFEYEYAEIAIAVDKKETNCRQIFCRAKKKLEGIPDHSQQGGYRQSQEPLIQGFVSAFMQGSVQALLELMTEDASLLADGGGKTRASINPIVSRAHVISLLTAKKAFVGFRESSFLITTVNGRNELIFYKDHLVTGVVCFDWTSDMERIKNIYIVVNPDKLQHIHI